MSIDFGGDVPALGTPQNIQWVGGGVGIPQFGGAGPNVIFHNHAVQNTLKSQELGRPYYEEFVFVRIQHPGERDVIHRKATYADTMAYSHQYNAFINKKEQTVQGTPIDLLCPGNPGIAGNLRAAGFMTVEQLAKASAPGISALGPQGQNYVTEAQRYLDAAKRGVDHHEVNRALKERDGKIRTQEQLLGAQQAQIQQMQKQIDNLIGQLGGTPTASPTQSQVKQPQDFGLPPPPFAMAQAEPEPTEAIIPSTRKRSRP